MIALRAFALLVLLAVAVPARADLIHYTFSGANGLSGSFELDGNTPFVITTDALGTTGVLTSPLNHIAGNFGAFSFTGVPTLQVFDGIPSLLNASDQWIVRSDITGPTVNGLTPFRLNLFINRSVGATTPISTTPPSHNFNQFDFQYSFSWKNGDFTTGALNTLDVVPVPEPTSAMMLVLGIAFTGGLYLRRNRG
jgi:hypothetical protein